MTEAGACAGSGGTGAERRKKLKPKSFFAASRALTGVMLKKLLRNEQDTRTLVPNPLSVAVAARAQAHNDAVQHKGRGHGLGPLFIWAWA